VVTTLDLLRGLAAVETSLPTPAYTPDITPHRVVTSRLSTTGCMGALGVSAPVWWEWCTGINGCSRSVNALEC
jgi:hypothetical protein